LIGVVTDLSHALAIIDDGVRGEFGEAKGHAPDDEYDEAAMNCRVGQYVALHLIMRLPTH
jgi:hypothetical protein